MWKLIEDDYELEISDQMFCVMYMTKSSITLTDSQRRVVDDIINSDRNEFITGGAGVGKGVVLNEIFEELCEEKCVSKVSPTGSSALLIGGTTIHSWVGIGIAIEPIDILKKKVRKHSIACERIDSCDVLIIDEISMISGDLLDKVDEIAKYIREVNAPFGGIRVIIVGDFYQLPPIVDKKSCLHEYAFQSNVWRKLNLRVHSLTETLRQKDDVFASLLKKIRIGDIDDEVDMLIQEHEHNSEIDSERSIKIRPMNDQVDRINERMLKLIDSPEKIYDANIEAETEEYRKDIIKYCNMKEKLVLKIGARVILLHNMDIANQLVNGSQGTVVGFVDDLPCVRFDTDPNKPPRPSILIDYHCQLKEEYITHKHEDGTIEHEHKIRARMTQIPLALGYACTIHKSQGQTFDHIDVDLSKIIGYGSAYVALSRCRTLNNMKISGWNRNKIKVNRTVKKFYENLELSE